MLTKIHTAIWQIISFHILYVQNILEIVLLSICLSVISVTFVEKKKRLKCPDAVLADEHLSSCMVCSSNL